MLNGQGDLVVMREENRGTGASRPGWKRGGEGCLGHVANVEVLRKPAPGIVASRDGHERCHKIGAGRSHQSERLPAELQVALFQSERERRHKRGAGNR